MKKILFILLLIPFILNGQTSKKISELDAATSVTGTELIPIVQGGETKSVTASIFSRYEGVGVYNVLDYGAISGDALDDADAINDAVTAAAAFIDSYFGDGIVYIPPGSYVISDSIPIRSNIHIDIAKGAYFYVGAYDGPIFYSNNTIVQNAKISGGTFYSANRLYTGIQITDTISEPDSYTAFCKFEDIYFYGCHTGIKGVFDNNGWANANYFESIKIADYIIGIDVKTGTNGAFGMNTFTDIHIQSSSNSEFGMPDFMGSGNTFVNLMLWDLPVGAIGATISGEANLFLGGHIPEATFEDNSVFENNTLLTNNKDLIRPIADRLMTYDNYYDRNIIDKLKIIASTEPGTVSAPAGDIGIKIGFAANNDFWNNGVDDNSADNSARIVADFTYPGSRLKFQTHSQTHSTTQYNNVMILDQNKGVSYPSSNTGTVATSITKAQLGRIIYYSEAAASDLSDNPQIVDGYDGQIITIIGSSDTNTLTLDDGTGLLLSAQCVLGAGDTITLVYITALSGWVEVSRSNN